MMEFLYNNNILNKNKLRESWFIKNEPDIFYDVKKFIKDNNLKMKTFSQELYHFNKKLKKLPNCEYCGGLNDRFVGFDSGYRKCCSKHCEILNVRTQSIEKRKQNTIEKYGVDHTSKLDSVKEKIKKTNIEKYGGVAPACNENVINKMIKTNIKKYGVEYPILNEDIKEKSREKIKKIVNDESTIELKKTNSLKKYGVEHPIASEIVKNKILETNIKKYGVNSTFETDNVKEKSKETINKKYGVEHQMKSDVVKNKMKLTKFNNFKENTKNTYKDLNIIEYKENRNIVIKCETCNKNYEISSNLLYLRNKNDIKLCLNCNKLNPLQSRFEHKIIDFLSNNNIKFDEKRRDIIKPKEIDIFLPEYNIGFEVNGYPHHTDRYKSDKYYHLNKTLNSKEKNIHLIHIWYDQMIYKFDIIKSRILNLVNKSEKIFARNCEIRLVNDNKIVKNFLDENHLQGYVGSSIKIGLYYKNELVSLMTFGKLRKALGQKSKENEFELIRFCNKLNLTVVGGANKLFNYFKNNYDFKKIISYANVDWTVDENKNLYTKLGFTFVDRSDVNYWWCDSTKRYYRYKYRKDVLVKMGYDKNKTENQIMYELGYYKMYDCGNYKFEYIK